MIQFLNDWNGYERYSIWGLAAPEEARLISIGLARNWYAGIDGLVLDAVVQIPAELVATPTAAMLAITAREVTYVGPDGSRYRSNATSDAAGSALVAVGNGSSATPAAYTTAGDVPITAAALGNASMVRVYNAGSTVLPVTIDASLLSSGRAIAFAPAIPGQTGFYLVPHTNITAPNWVVEGGATVSSIEAVSNTVYIGFFEDGKARALSGVKLASPLANQAVLGQANPNTIAIFGNSIIASGACPRTIYASTAWQPSTAVSAAAVAGPKYWNLQSGISANKWVCTTAGTTGTLEPNWPHGAATGTTVTDGTVVWTYTALGGALTPWAAWNFGFWHIAQALSGQRLDEAIIVGRSGSQSPEILSYVDRAIADPNVGTIYFANIFENDTWPSTAPTLATITANWNAFVVKADAARASGKRVMVQTLLPSANIDSSSGFTGYAFGNGSKAWIWLNSKLRQYARARGDVILWDAASVYVDANPANPVYPENTVTYLSSGATGQALKKTDGIHPYLSAHYLLGVSLGAVLAANFQPRPIFTHALDDKAQTVNPLMFGTSGTRGATIGSGTVPNSLSMDAFGGVSGSCASSSVARTDITGNWARLVYGATAGDNASLSWTSFQTSVVSAGQVVQAYAEIRVLANPTLFVLPMVQLRMLSAADPWAYSSTLASVDQDIGQMITVDTIFTLKTPPLVWPTGVTTVGVYSKAMARGAASFTVDFGRQALLRSAAAAAA